MQVADLQRTRGGTGRRLRSWQRASLETATAAFRVSLGLGLAYMKCFYVLQTVETMIKALHL